MEHGWSSELGHPGDTQGQLHPSWDGPDWDLAENQCTEQRSRWEQVAGDGAGDVLNKSTSFTPFHPILHTCGSGAQSGGF